MKLLNFLRGNPITHDYFQKQMRIERNRRYYLKHRDEIRRKRRAKYYLTGK